MQKQTFKLPKNLALGFAALMLAVAPNTADASCWQFIGLARVAFNWFGAKKPKVTGIKLPVIKDKAVEKFQEPGEIETEAENFMRALDLGIGFAALYKFNDMMGLGLLLDLGVSFSKEQQKSWKSLTISEAFVGKLGIAMSITDWVVLAAGIRLAYLTLDLTFSDDDKTALTDRQQPHNTVTPPVGIQTDDIKFDGSKSYSGSTWAWGLFFDVNVLIPISDNLRFLITAGVFGDVSSPEFKDMFKDMEHCTAVNAAGTAPTWGDKKTFSPKIENRLGLRIGLGLAFAF
jgi:hypothetical protein